MKQVLRTSKDIYTESLNRLFPPELPEHVEKYIKDISIKFDDDGVLTNVVEEYGIKFIDTKKGLIPQHLTN